MPIGTPAIAAIGVIGKNDNPLHISLFPSLSARDELEFQFLLHTSLDVFEARLPTKTADHDFGLLQAVDERYAMYGWLTNTGVKLVIVVDMEGKEAEQDIAKDNAAAVLGLRDADLKPAFKALHLAYIKLLRNPFYDPDDPSPRSVRGKNNVGALQINSTIFNNEVCRIGEAWYPGITTI